MNLFQAIFLLVLLQLHNSLAQKSTVTRCITPDNKMGKCISIRECRDLLQLLEYKSKDPKVVQFLRNSHCGTVGNDPKVCCSSGITSPANNANVDLPDLSTCGTPEVAQKIIGGEGVQLGDYPWMVALGYKRKYRPGLEWICGGTLISSRYVLTAAHCLYGVEPWELSMVRLGDVNLNDTIKDGATPLNVPVEHTILHEKYTNSPVTNDIALVKLRYPVQYTNVIKPICLPAAYELRMASLDNQYGFVTGWGRTTFDGPYRYSSLLQELKIPILSVDVCKRSYRTIPRSHIDNRNICAGFIEGHKDSCQGDSGGPLMWINPQDSKYYLVGIVSYGYKCAEPGFPGIYTKVSEYIDWIKFNAN